MPEAVLQIYTVSLSLSECLSLTHTHIHTERDRDRDTERNRDRVFKREDQLQSTQRMGLRTWDFS